MSKKKTSTDDFLRLLDEEESASQLVAFSPSSKSSEPSSNIVQTSVKPSSEPSSNIVQTAVKPSSEITIKDKIKSETWFKPSSEPSSLIVQTSFKSSSNLVQKFNFHMLSPLQQKLLALLYEEGQISRSKVSPPLNGATLANRLESSIEGLRTAVKRLVKAGFLLTPEVKSGRTGWTKYELPEWVYQHMVLNETWFKSSSNLVQTWFKPSSKPSSEPSSTIPCSSSSNININNTTTTEDHFLSIPPKLEGQLPLHQIRALLKSGSIDQTTLEDSLWGFAHDLEKGLVKSKTGNTTGLFIGALKNGGYISQQYLSQKQQEILELKERLEEFKKLQAELDNNQLIEEFEAFKAKYPEKAEQIKPAGQFIKSFESGSIGYRMWLDEYKRSTAVALDLEVST